MTIQVRDAGARGRGVFAVVPFATGQLIEQAPVIPYPEDEKEHVGRTALADYPYDWADGGEAMAMGCGSFYNHSYRPNAFYRKNFDRRTIDFIALRTIAAGEEITINYNGTSDGGAILWFMPEPEAPPSNSGE
jgi:SET domain-containing protein